MQRQNISYKRHRFPAQIIAHAVWLYCRFNLSLRKVEEMLLERGIDVSFETIRRWVAKFGSAIARSLRRRNTRAAKRLLMRLMKKHGIAKLADQGCDRRIG